MGWAIADDESDFFRDTALASLLLSDLDGDKYMCIGLHYLTALFDGHFAFLLIDLARNSNVSSFCINVRVFGKFYQKYKKILRLFCFPSFVYFVENFYNRTQLWVALFSRWSNSHFLIQKANFCIYYSYWCSFRETWSKNVLISIGPNVISKGGVSSTGTWKGIKTIRELS